MAIRVVPGSASLVVTQKPTVAKPAKDATNTNMTFTCQHEIKMSGRCQITGDPGDNPAGWTLGLIQLQWIETNWGDYRGQSQSDGSCFLQRARPPARLAQGCRDTLAVGAIFVDNNPGLDRTVAAAGTPFPINMTAVFKDGPGDAYPLTRVNTVNGTRIPGITNFLREVQLEFHFCTILTLMDPDPARRILAMFDLASVFRHLKHVYWNVHWQAKFRPTNFANIAAPWTITPTGGALGNMGNASITYDGGPTTPKFAGNLTDLLAPNCNQVAIAASGAPNTKESPKWEDFNVTQ